jgi:hypothetical protein
MQIESLTPEEEAELTAYLQWELENSHDVVAFEIVAPYTIHMIFDDGKEQTINFKPLLWGVHGSLLHDEKLFNQVFLYHGLLSWLPDGEAPGVPPGTPTVDFNPAFLYTWPEMEAEMIEQANEWRATQAKEAQEITQSDRA